MSSSSNKSTCLIFVYGSLKRGFGNNRYFLSSDAEFVGPCTTADSNFDMISLGSFPAVFRNSDDALYPPAGELRNCRITGEVYRVDAKTLVALDMLEGNGSFYTREQIEVDGLPQGENLCWCYLISDKGDMAFWSSEAEYSRARVRVRHNEATNTLTWANSNNSFFNSRWSKSASDKFNV